MIELAPDTTTGDKRAGEEYVGGQDHGTGTQDYDSTAPPTTRSTSSSPNINPSDKLSEAFTLRKLLGTGDTIPAPRGKRARHLVVGATYHNITFNVACTVQEINEDGDVQITFPNTTDEDPTTLYTAGQEEIGTLENDIFKAEAKQQETTLQMPHPHPLVESNDGVIFSTAEFTAELLCVQRPTRQAESSYHSIELNADKARDTNWR